MGQCGPDGLSCLGQRHPTITYIIHSIRLYNMYWMMGVVSMTTESKYQSISLVFFSKDFGSCWNYT